MHRTDQLARALCAHLLDGVSVQQQDDHNELEVLIEQRAASLQTLLHAVLEDVGGHAAQLHSHRRRSIRHSAQEGAQHGVLEEGLVVLQAQAGQAPADGLQRDRPSLRELVGLQKAGCRDTINISSTTSNLISSAGSGKGSSPIREHSLTTSSCR